MHEKRITRYEPIAKPEFDSRMRKLTSKKHDELRRRRKRERQARKTQR